MVVATRLSGAPMVVATRPSDHPVHIWSWQPDHPVHVHAWLQAAEPKDPCVQPAAGTRRPHAKCSSRVLRCTAEQVGPIGCYPGLL